MLGFYPKLVADSAHAHASLITEGRAIYRVQFRLNSHWLPYPPTKPHNGLRNCYPPSRREERDTGTSPAYLDARARMAMAILLILPPWRTTVDDIASRVLAAW